VASVVSGIGAGVDFSDILALRLGMSLAPSSPMAPCLNLIPSAAAPSAVATKSNCAASDDTYSLCGIVSVWTRPGWTQLLQILDILVTHRRSLPF